VTNPTPITVNNSDPKPFDEGRFLRLLYQYGPKLVGLVLVFGLSVVAFSGDPGRGDDGSALLYVKIALLLLWCLPVLALIGPGVIAIRRNRTSLSGWLAVVMAIILSALWTLV
jgi:hypothetical protein